MKIKYQLFLTHGLLVVLSLMIVFINVIAYQGMTNDASIINQSGKLRALSYNMVQISNKINDSDHYHDQYNVLLQKKINEFDINLMTLSGENNKSDLIISHNSTILRLEKIIYEWNEIFKPSYIEMLENGPSDRLYTLVNNEIDLYVNEIDEMVTSYSLFSSQKVIRALAINAALVFIIIIVTLYSFITTNSKIQKPMKLLIGELKDLSLFDDEVSKKLKNINTDEISEMTQYFNEMMYDQLTKTLNRRSGMAKLSRLFQYDNRRQLEISLCFIDINGLKVVNDYLGHKFGDELIVSAVDCIKKEIRDDDFIIRMGGDEFLIVFQGANEEISEKVWDRINNSYRRINENENRPYAISVSHGIVEYNNTEKSEVEVLIKSADDKMYAEKKCIKEESDFKIIK